MSSYQTSGIDRGRTPTVVVGLLAIVAAVALAASPFLSWHSIDLGEIGSFGRNGFGDVSYDGPLAAEADGDDGFTLSADPETSADDHGWILGSIADGVPVVAAGALVGLIGLVLVVRNGRLTGADRRRERRVLAVLLIVLAVLGIGWTAASYVRFTSDIDEVEEEAQTGDDGFESAFFQTVETEPGIGTLLAGLATVGLGLLGLAGLVVGGSSRRPIPSYPSPGHPGASYPPGAGAPPAAPAAGWDPNRPTFDPNRPPPPAGPPPAGGGPTPWSGPPSPS